MKQSTKLNLLTYSIGIVFILFGMLKFFPNLSPAEEIGSLTVKALSFGILSKKMALLSLAILEVAIGLGIFIPRFRKVTIILAIAHMICTFSPFFIFPSESFAGDSFAPTLLGQYILKNIILICALLVIYPTKEEKSAQKSTNKPKVQNMWIETLENQQTNVAFK